MVTINGLSANAVWMKAVSAMKKNGLGQESRDQPTRELLHVAFKIKDPRQRIVFGRDINPAFAIAEVIWILSGSNDLDFLKFWNPRMKIYSDDGYSLYGAYGYRLGIEPDFSSSIKKSLYRVNKYNAQRSDQIKLAYEALRETPNSRQVVLQIWNSNSDLPSRTPRSKDIPCNLISHLMIRDNKLEWLQVMRSNDLMWGTPYNIIQFTMIQEIMAGWLNIDVGSYNHVSDSLHVYERHFEDLESISDKDNNSLKNTADLRIFSFDEWEKIWEKLIYLTISLSKETDYKIILDLYNGAKAALPPAYFQLFSVLTAEALRKKGNFAESFKIIKNAGNYWEFSWKRWAENRKGTI